MTERNKTLTKVKLADITLKIGSGATPKGGKESYQGSGITLQQIPIKPATKGAN